MPALQRRSGHRLYLPQDPIASLDAASKVAVRIRPTDELQLKYIFQRAFLHPSAFQSHAIVTLPSESTSTCFIMP